MRKLVGVMLVGVLLTGCGTSVPLNDVPVVDATAKPVAVTPVQGSGASSSGVAPVDLGGTASQASPTSAPRVIYFDYDSFVIKPEFQKLIADHAQVIKKQSARRVAIEGHTDETGGREYNLALGQKRADAVAGALAILGVPKTQLESVSFGKEKPAVAGNDESAYAKNRRAEIRYQ
jgi:peptidoglycan-associated lipoprotein